MEKQKERMPINGKSAITKKAIGFGIIGFLGTTVVFLGIKHMRSKKQTMKDSSKKEVRFVFFSPDGLPISLSEQEVYNVKQQYEDGVSPVVIAKEHNMSTGMVFRIISCMK